MALGNYELKAEVGRLENQLHKIERENNQLRGEINSTVNQVNQAEQNLSEYNRHVRENLEHAAGTINNAVNRAVNAYELQGQIDHLYMQYKRVELANKKIRTLNNKKYYDFNHYRTVRKIVQGMMDNLDLDMVSDAVIYKLIEKQHLQTPDFWLTSALISIMAWKNNDKTLADRALESAVKLDRKNSCIFYMIFNMRMGREKAAVKWFLEYQKCDLKGSDEDTFLLLFSLISKTLTDTVDEETADLISDFIHKLILESIQKEGCSESDVIGLLCNKMLAMVKTQSYDLPLSSKYCKDYGAIIQMLNMAGNNYNILEFIFKVIHVSAAEKNTYLKEYLNELLAKPNPVETETYREIEYQELVIRLNGDTEKAKEIFAQKMQKKESELNIISSIVEWIYDLGNEKISGQMRLNMFTLIKTFQEKAVNACFERYRNLYTDVHPVQILDYSAEVNFLQETSEREKAEVYYQQRQKEELAAVKNRIAYAAFGVGAACGIVAFFVHFLLLAGFGVGAAIGTGILISNHSKRKNIMQNIKKQKESVLDILQKLFGEQEKIKTIYKEYDEISFRILQEFAKL